MMKKTLALLLVGLLTVTFLAACGGEEVVEVVDYFAPGEYQVVNIAESRRMLKVAPVLVTNVVVTDDEAMTTAMKAITPAIREVFNEHLRLKTEEDLLSSGIIDQIKQELTQALVSELQLDYVVDIYFSDFVLQ